MDENQPAVTPIEQNPVSSASAAPTPMPAAPVLPTPPEGGMPKKSNKGLLVILLVVLLSLAVLGAVTVMALKGNQADNTTPPVTQATPTPTPTISPVATQSALPNSDKTADIKRDLDQTTVTDPTSDVDSLSSDVNKL